MADQSFETLPAPQVRDRITDRILDRFEEVSPEAQHHWLTGVWTAYFVQDPKDMEALGKLIDVDRIRERMKELRG